MTRWGPGDLEHARNGWGVLRHPNRCSGTVCVTVACGRVVPRAQAPPRKCAVHFTWERFSLSVLLVAVVQPDGILPPYCLVTAEHIPDNGEPQERQIPGRHIPSSDKVAQVLGMRGVGGPIHLQPQGQWDVKAPNVRLPLWRGSASGVSDSGCLRTWPLCGASSPSTDHGPQGTQIAASQLIPLWHPTSPAYLVPPSLCRGSILFHSWFLHCFALPVCWRSWPARACPQPSRTADERLRCVGHLHSDRCYRDKLHPALCPPPPLLPLSPCVCVCKASSCDSVCLCVSCDSGGWLIGCLFLAACG